MHLLENRLENRLTSKVYRLIDDRSLIAFSKWTKTLSYSEQKELGRLMEKWR